MSFSRRKAQEIFNAVNDEIADAHKKLRETGQLTDEDMHQLRKKASNAAVDAYGKRIRKASRDE